ncbi:MAG: MFS transporter, partial [Armatimonadota bacterium]|nr:MFS transporter [Armatimonadota bacterium]
GLWYFVGLVGQLAILLSLFLLHLPVAAGFLLVAGLMLLTMLLTCFNTREPTRLAPSAPAASHWDELKQAAQGLKTLRQMRIYLLTFFLYGVGIDAVVPNLSLFIQNVTHCSDTLASAMPIALLACAALGSAPFGWLSDRIGPKRLLMASLAMIALAALGGLWVHSLLTVGLVLALAGLGTAAQNASAFPLLTRLVPAEEVGFYTGLQTAALSVAGPLSIWGTGALVNHQHHDYRLIFLVCFLGIAASLLSLRFVRLSAAPDEIAARRLLSQRRT